MPKQRISKELRRALELVRNPRMKIPKLLNVLETAQIERVRKIVQHRNVVGIGIAEKEIGKRKRGTGELSLCFYVVKKYAKPKHPIPPVLSVGNRVAVFTDVQEIGKIRPHINKLRSPILSGYSIGNGDATGTLGAIVKKGNGYFFLSSSHVLAKSGNGTIGDPVIYPGPADLDGKPPQNVANLSNFVIFEKTGIVNRVDAALAKVDEESVHNLNFSLYNASRPLGIIDAEIGMRISMRGRTSGNSEGRVKSTTFSYTLKYPGVGDIGFIDQVGCSPYAEDGDSGALVIDQTTGKIVGLHCGGSPSFSFFNPISEVTKALNFRFIDG